MNCRHVGTKYIEGYLVFSKLESVKGLICGLGRLDLHHIRKKNRMMFFWQLAHLSSNILQDFLIWCYFDKHFLYDSELIVMLNGKHLQT